MLIIKKYDMYTGKAVWVDADEFTRKSEEMGTLGHTGILLKQYTTTGREKRYDPRGAQLTCIVAAERKKS